MLDMLVFDVDLKRVPVLIVLAAVRTSYCLFCTRVYVLHVANKVLCRDIFITSLTVDLTCNLIKDHSWSRPINIVYHSQVLLTGGVVFENLLAHWTFDLIVRSMHISCVPWVVLCINVLIAVSTEKGLKADFTNINAMSSCVTSAVIFKSADFCRGFCGVTNLWLILNRISVFSIWY